jgi:hypothetical protein
MVLVLVTAIGLIVGVLALSMVDLGYHARILSIRNVEGMSARAAADAGVADAVFWMQKKLIREAHWDEAGYFPRTVTGTLPGTHASYSYTISTVDSGRRFRIESTGSDGPQNKTVSEVIRVGSLWQGVGVLTTFDAKNGVTLQGGIGIRTNAATASEGQIVLKNGVIVPGDVIIGPGGDIDSVLSIKSGTIIQGSVYAADDALVFPPVSAPTPALTRPAITATTTIGTSGTYQYPSITLPNSGQLIVTAPNVKVYVTGAVSMKNSAEVVVRAGASLELYLGGSLDSKNSTGFSNLTNDPTHLKIYGLPGCTQMDFKNSATVYAAIYAPNAAVTMYNSAAVYGAICANSVAMKNSSILSFDTRVASVLIDDDAAQFETELWSED